MAAKQISEANALPGSERIAAFLDSRDLLKFFAYWQSKRSGRELPSRSDMDPIDIPWALSRSFLVDFEPPDTFRYRVAGREIEEVFGCSMKGATLADILPPDIYPLIAGRWLPLVGMRAVVCMKGLIYGAKDRQTMGERIMLPLADEDGGPVTGLFGMTVFTWLSGAEVSERKTVEVETIPVATIPFATMPS
ncbi:PAS domain-containing protein [Hwanghaeella sp.]|uniref:PAS domain-containing protein n=1 Tax=Hwanghaeella sp. TaxID=2605943 RepID=UPI003CCB8EDB